MCLNLSKGPNPHTFCISEFKFKSETYSTCRHLFTSCTGLVLSLPSSWTTSHVVHIIFVQYGCFHQGVKHDTYFIASYLIGVRVTTTMPVTYNILFCMVHMYVEKLLYYCFQTNKVFCSTSTKAYFMLLSSYVYHSSCTKSTFF